MGRQSNFTQQAERRLQPTARSCRRFSYKPGCNIDAEGAEALTFALEKNKTLQELEFLCGGGADERLNECPVEVSKHAREPARAETPLDRLARAPIPTVYVRRSNMSIGSKGTVALASVCIKNPTVRVLSFECSGGVDKCLNGRDRRSRRRATRAWRLRSIDLTRGPMPTACALPQGL